MMVWIIFTEKKAVLALIRMVDKKVLSNIRLWQNGAILLIDGLEQTRTSGKPKGVRFWRNENRRSTGIRLN